MQRQKEKASNRWRWHALRAALASIGAIAGEAAAFEIEDRLSPLTAIRSLFA